MVRSATAPTAVAVAAARQQQHKKNDEQNGQHDISFLVVVAVPAVAGASNVGMIFDQPVRGASVAAKIASHRREASVRPNSVTHSAQMRDRSASTAARTSAASMSSIP